MPIHDQNIYIDKKMMKRYWCLAHTLIQFLGDAIIIPSGAPRQVKNIKNCIKVALDLAFVSPQGIKEFIKLSEEFRKLTDDHTNHEDKLQVREYLF